MRTKPNTPPDGEQEITFLDSGAVPELNEILTGTDDVDELLKELGDAPGIDDLIRDAANLPGMDDLIRDSANLPGIADLLDDGERIASQLLDACTPRKPARRCHRPRRRGKA